MAGQHGGMDLRCQKSRDGLAADIETGGSAGDAGRQLIPGKNIKDGR
jgi:hypothetical protein